MSNFASVVRSLVNTAALIGCLWWANWALRQLDISRRFNLSAGVRLLVVLAVGALAYSPVSRIVSGLFTLFGTYDGWYKTVEVFGALAVLGFVGWLYSKAILER